MGLMGIDKCVIEEMDVLLGLATHISSMTMSEPSFPS